MFKILVLQHFYNLSDDQTEFQIRDLYCFCRFLGLSPEGKVPDAKTIWVFRERLKALELVEPLFPEGGRVTGQWRCRVKDTSASQWPDSQFSGNRLDTRVGVPFQAPPICMTRYRGDLLNTETFLE